MATLQVVKFDDALYRTLAIRAAERGITKKELVTLAICKELGVPMPEMPVRGRPVK